MGKSIIVKDASFSANGMKDSYIDFTIENGKASPTQQGHVVFGNDTTAHQRRNMLQSNGGTYSNYVKSTKAIRLKPGDSIAIMSPPSPLSFMCIYGYRDIYVNTNRWPIYTPTSSQQAITLYNGSRYYSVYSYRESSSFPIAIKNTLENNDFCIVLQGRKSSGKVTPTEVPYIEYRIYTDHPEYYEEDTEEETDNTEQNS